MSDQRQRKIGILVFMGVGAVVALIMSQEANAATPSIVPISYKLGFWEQRKVEAAVAEGLREPESARFESIRGALMPDGTIVACGFVSGRNGFGGMGNPIPFHTQQFSSGDFSTPLLEFERSTAHSCYAAGLFSAELLQRIRERN